MSAGAFDVAVVGGGIAGRAAAIAVAKSGCRTLHLAPPAPPDRRTSALMGPTVDFLGRLGVVEDPALAGCPLRRVRIIDATSRLVRAPEALFDSQEVGREAFGWNFANTALADACERVAAGLAPLTTRPQSLVTLEAGADGDQPVRLTLSDGQSAEAALVVGADGRNSAVRGAVGIATREHKFAEAALVCDLILQRPLGATSVEFHYPHGPFTLVPAGENRANLVWIDDRSVLDEVRSLPSATIAERLAVKAQSLFGAVELTSPPVVFPLSTLSVGVAGRCGVVLVGESAHAFPPIGAQGLNLGLRDVADLADLLRDTDREVPGWAGRLSRRYAERRAGDLARTGAIVDGLFRSLIAEMLPAQAARAAGLWALKLLPPIRRQAFAAGMGTR